MQSWSWEDYAARIRAKGYSIMIRPGKKGPYGYSIGKGKARFKASEPGTGRKLRASRIEDIWNRLHSQSEAKSVQPVKKAGIKPVALFVGLTALDTVSTDSGGGGLSNDDNWRDRKDEDEIERARRCARAAAGRLCKTPKSGRRR